tara:strand:+ start:1442 stop:1942 length:501 start_codon:yes stop_codon:yes gene_type:complete
MKNPTQGTIQKATAEEVITSFYGLNGAAAAIKASDFDVMEEITTVIQLTRDPDPKVALPALRHFRILMKEIVSANGMIGTVTQTETLPDTNVSRSMSSSALLTNLRNQNDKIEDQNQKEANHKILTPKNRGEESGDSKVKKESGASGEASSNDGGDALSSILSSGD